MSNGPNIPKQILMQIAAEAGIDREIAKLYGVSKGAVQNARRKYPHLRATGQVVEVDVSQQVGVFKWWGNRWVMATEADVVRWMGYVSCAG